MSALKVGLMLLLLALSVTFSSCETTPKTTTTPWHKAPMKDGLPWDAYHAP